MFLTKVFFLSCMSHYLESVLAAHICTSRAHIDSAFYFIGMAVIPLYINLYSDGFGIYKRKYHSTRGNYMSFGNLPRKLAAERKNIHVIGLAEPGKEINSY